MRLDELDERLVPRLATRLRAALDAAADRRARIREGLVGRGARLRASRSSALRRLDDRYAAHGPLALLRDVPQLGLLLVAAVFLAGSGLALERSSTQRNAANNPTGPAASLPTTLGPEPGTLVAAYVAETRKRAMLLSQATPDAEYTALVSFSRYQTPQQARLLLGDLRVTRVLAHVQLPAAEVLPIPVTGTLVADIRTTFAAVAKRKLRDRQEFVNLATSITGSSKEELQFKAFYGESAQTAAKEAAAYAKGCACLFAAVVRGKARDLAALPALPAVRAVDIGAGEPDTLQIRPLLPEQKVRVTKPVLPGAGNGG